MARFFTLLLIPIATYSLQAIDKHSGKADHKGDVFNLGDLLADVGDDRLKNALKKFRENRVKLTKAADNLFLANNGILLQPNFNPRNFLPPNKQQLMMGVARSKTLIKAASDYQAALDEYKKFVNKTLSPTTPRAMTDSFAPCRDWAENSRILADNVQVYFEHLINGAIPVKPSKAKELVAFLEKKVRINKEVVANQIVFDREDKKLKIAEAELKTSKANHDKAKATHDKAFADLIVQEKMLPLRKAAVTEANKKLFEKNKRFGVINDLVKSFANDTAAKDALNKDSLALNAATKALAVATNAVNAAKDVTAKAASALTAANLASTTAANAVNAAKDVTAKAQAAFTAADTAAKAEEANAKKIAGDANKTKEEKDAANKNSVDKRKAADTTKATLTKAQATEAAAVKAAADKAKALTDAKTVDAKAKAAVASTNKAVSDKAKANEKAKKAEDAARKKAATANIELIKAQENVNKITADGDKAEPAGGKPIQTPAPKQVKPPTNQLANNQRPSMLQEKDANKELGSLKVEKEKARLAFEEAVRQEIATDKLLMEAMNTLEKVKPVFEAAQKKLRDSTVKEARQREKFNGAESKLRESKSDLNKVEFQIEENRATAWENCVRARESLRDGYVKPEQELENDPVPFVRD